MKEYDQTEAIARRCCRLSQRAVLAIAFVLLVAAACRWSPVDPGQVVPTPMEELSIDVVQVPTRICTGHVAEFVIKTSAGNGCGAAVAYANSKGSWKGLNLEENAAGADGLCRWTWLVPTDAMSGQAEFRATAEGHGNSRMAIESFYIEKCR